MFVDAFGWTFFKRYADRYPFLRAFQQEGVVSKLTSQFPSTTAAHVTCIHTGLEVGQSGVYEWNYYEPLIDEMITPLMFSYAGDKIRDTLQQAGIVAEKILPRQSFYQILKAQGIPCHIFQSAVFTPSTYSTVLYQDVPVHPYKSVSEALTELASLVLHEASSPGYYLLYVNEIDAMGHLNGPGSAQFEQAVHHFFSAAEQHFLRPTRRGTGKTLLLLTADHGQIPVDPHTTFYLNRHAPGIERYLQTNRKGNLLVPAGSARDMFLHVKPNLIDDALAYLRKLLAGNAEVYTTRELAEQGFFGKTPLAPVFWSRVGNIVILPYARETVWWYEPGKFAMNFTGHHGGLLPEEMEIPLLLLAL
jgi:hypothetical protein